MDKVIEMILGSIKEKKFDLISKIIIFIFTFMAPSYLILFLFERNIFYKMEFSKLIVLCIILNILLFAITYIIILIRASEDFLNNIKNNNFDITPKEFKEKQSEVYLKALFKTEQVIISITIVDLVIYIYSHLKNKNISSNFFITLSIALYLFYLLIDLIKVFIAFFKYFIRDEIKDVIKYICKLPNLIKEKLNMKKKNSNIDIKQ